MTKRPQLVFHGCNPIADTWVSRRYLGFEHPVISQRTEGNVRREISGTIEITPDGFEFFGLIQWDYGITCPMSTLAILAERNRDEAGE
jgi:hypothetical protein